MSNNYYLRWKGKELGDYSLQEIQRMLEDGDIGKHHQISEDGQEWLSLVNSPELQQLCKPSIKQENDADKEATNKPIDSKSDALRIQVKSPDPLPAANAANLESHDLYNDEEHWYYLNNDAVVGPIGAADINDLIVKKIIRKGTLVCREGEQNWNPAIKTFPHLFTPASKKAAGNFAGETELVYAGFWRRAMAYIIDGVIVSAILFLIGIVSQTFIESTGAGFDIYDEYGGLQEQMSYGIITALVSWLYFALSESSSQKATLGKRSIGLIVTDMEKQQISFGRASVRYWSKILSNMIFMIGYLMAAFTARKQALHDMIADTLVLKKISFLK